MSDISSQPFADRANRTNSSPATSGDGRPSPTTIILTLLNVLLLLLVVWKFVGIYLLGGANANDAKDQIELLKAKSAIVTGVFGVCSAVVAAFLLYWRSHSLARQAGANQRQAEIANQVHLTSLFSAAVAQLDVSEEVTRETQFSPMGHAEQIVEKSVTKSPSRSTRLGAIHTLERVIRASQYDPTNVHGKQDAAAVFAMLGGYLGARSREVRPARPGKDPIPSDLAAALLALGGQARGERTDVRYLALDHWNLSDSIFARLSLRDASFRGVAFYSSVFEDDTLADTVFADAFMVPGQDVHAPPIKFSECELTKTNFIGARLYGMIFEKTTFNGVDFLMADIPRTKFFDGCVFKDITFTGADLSYVEFGPADVSAVNFMGCLLAGADLSKTKGLESTQIASAFGDVETKLPPNLAPPASWAQKGSSSESFGRFREILVPGI